MLTCRPFFSKSLRLASGAPQAQPLHLHLLVTKTGHSGLLGCLLGEGVAVSWGVKSDIHRGHLFSIFQFHRHLHFGACPRWWHGRSVVILLKHKSIVPAWLFTFCSPSQSIVSLEASHSRQVESPGICHTWANTIVDKLKTQAQ